MSQSHLPPEEPHLSSEAPPQEGPAASQNPAPPAEDTAAQKAGKEKKPGAFGADLYGWLQALTFALAFILIFFTFFGRVIGVDGHSMDPTLNDRDMLFLQCIAYEPKQGDVVVLHKDFGDVETPIVKRVIAVGGQTVEIDYDTGTVYVDGQPLEEDYIMEPMVRPESPYLQGTYWEVPEGSVFVMGDNRNNSSDSRDSRLGPVDTRYVLGRAICTVLPLPHTPPLGKRKENQPTEKWLKVSRPGNCPSLANQTYDNHLITAQGPGGQARN